jgi:energy-coupling factor transporter ATP-binding protein EcfA2
MDFKLRDMFFKDINRDIKGVIKVGQHDEENIKQELEEYVVTNELKRHLDVFFEAYKNGTISHTDNMGVWLMGFFGSGKSHLLKILSYLLQNKVIDGKKAIEYFDNKGLDNFTLANIKQAGDISTDVILFNIDSKTNSNLKSNKVAIVNVFNKVFNEMQGLSGSLPWLAELEYKMQKDGVYEDFKRVYYEISDKVWEKSRDDFYYEQNNIIKALSRSTKMTEQDAKDWCKNYREEYTLTIEDFSKRVKEYIDSKGKNHHVVFLVDEIGQYIGDNTQLMLNLQTVVEELGTRCGGKCWVIVTSQEGLDEFTNVKGNDFSKIQGRFATRLSLSSANVDEVIKKRILRKTDGAASHLKALYEQKESIIKNLLTFTTDTAEMKLYKNSEDFAEVYPFVPYQFNLLQAAFNGVREHGASGKSLSKGERSLLGAYQQVAVRYMNNTTEVLMPFSAFYSTIETFLDSSIRSVIIHAEKNERLNEFDVEVLKLLFLIKYVKEIKSNIENISTLLVKNIDDDKVELKKKVQESLRRLIRETLVQENGEEFIFLTNDEQDVNKEIKNMAVDNGEIIQKVWEIIFDDIYGDSKFAYSKRYNFTFNKIVDDRTRGPQINEIGIRVITANYELVGGTSESELKFLSSRENNVIINISRDVNYLNEIEQVLKIDAYLRVKSGSRASQSIEDIKSKKSRERDERMKRAKFLLEEALKASEIYVNGSLLNIKEKNGLHRINEGLTALIDSKFNKLNYIKDFLESTKELYDILDKKINQMSLMDIDPNRLAIDEVNTHISTSTSRNLQVTVKSILTKYSNAPYGWKDIDIQGVIVNLFKKQEIRVILNGEVLPPNDKEIVNYVTKRDYVDRVILKTREKVNKKYIDAVKDLNKDLFGFSSLPTDEDGIMNIFKDECKKELSRINELLVNYSNKTSYPGETVLTEGKQLFEKITDIKDTLEFFKEVYEMEDGLLDYVNAIDNIKGFFYKKENGVIDFSSRGEQRVIFDNALSKLQNYEENKEYIVNDEIVAIINEIKSVLRMKEPYGKLPTVPLLVEKYNSKVLQLLEEESIPVKSYIDACRAEVLAALNDYDFKDSFADKVMQEFNNMNSRLESANSFAVLSSLNDLADKLKIKWIKEILEEDRRLKIIKAKKDEEARGKVITKGKTTTNTSTSAQIIREHQEVLIKTKTLSMRELVKGQKVIKNEDDINEVVEALRGKLKEELEKDTILSLV